MKTKSKLYKPGIFLASLLILSLLTTLTAFARSSTEDAATVHVTRLRGPFVGIKIIFPDDLSGEYAGTLGASHFDCSVVASNTLYCVGPFDWSLGPQTLNIYENHAPYTMVLVKIIVPPPSGPRGPEVTPPPAPQPTPTLPPPT